MKHILEAQQASFMALLTEIQRNWGPASRENKRKEIEQRITEFVYDPEGGVNFEAWFRKYEGLFEDEGAELDDKTKVEIMLLKLAQREHERAHNAARTTLGSSSLHQKEQHDRHSSGAIHQIGDLVMYYNPSHARGTSAKFHYPWQGPFLVLDTPSLTTLLIRDAIYPNARPFTAHFDKLKPYRGRLPTCYSDSLPILPADQVPPVAIEVTVSSPLVDLSIYSAPP
ncbi:hypothetical protein SprV_0301353700 [Sparganum proliferum]